MFMVFSKEKIVSYLISLSTVAFLFIMSFAITKRNEEIIKTSANVLEKKVMEENVIEQNAIIESENGNNINNTNMNEIIEDNNGNVTKKLQK